MPRDLQRFKLYQEVPSVELQELFSFLFNVKDKYNLLLDTLQYEEQNIYSGESNKLPTDTYFVINARKNEANVWKKIDMDKSSWALAFDSTGVNDKMYILYCGVSIDPITWTTYLTVNSTGIPSDPTDIVPYSSLDDLFILLQQIGTVKKTHTQKQRYGGTGIDSSQSTGIPKITAGYWTINASAVDVPVVDSGGYYSSSDVENVLQEIGSGISTLTDRDLIALNSIPKKDHKHKAEKINVVDAADYYVGTEVETILQEIGSDLIELGDADFLFACTKAKKNHKHSADAIHDGFTNIIPTSTQETNWDTAYGWGDHASAGYFIKASDDLDDITEGTTNKHLTFTLKGNYDAAYSHKITEDAINGLVKCDGAGSYSAVTDNSTNWNTAYGWGDHAGLYTPLAFKTTLDAINGLIECDGAGNYSAGSGYTDEEAQDAVGGILDNGTTGEIDFTYDDATPKISGELHIAIGSSGFYSDRKYYQAITVDHTKVSGAGTISDYMLRVVITDEDNPVFTRSQADGDDIVFTDDSNNLLPFRLVKFDTTNHILIAWVLTDVSALSDTVLRLYYGSSTAASEANTTTTTAGYETFYPLNGDIADYGSREKDATDSSTSEDTSGQIDSARAFVGASSQYFHNSTDGWRCGQFGEGSVGMWVKHTSSARMDVCGCTNTGTHEGFSIGVNKDQNDANVENKIGVFLRDYNGKYNKFATTDAVAGLDDGNWHHIAIKWAFAAGGNTHDIFVDGVSKPQTEGTNNDAAPSFSDPWDYNFTFGCSNNRGTLSNYYTGSLDEIWFYPGNLSDDYIVTLYNNESDPSSFFSLGAEQEGDYKTGQELFNEYIAPAKDHADAVDAISGLVKGDGAGSYSAVTDNSSNWDTAYGWGDHSEQVGEDRRNVIVAFNSVTQIDVDFDILQVGQYNLTAGNLTIAITTSGANGLDTGSEAANTWYAVYVIYNPTTDTIAGLLSADTAVPSTSNAPTLPSGYTVWRHVGWVRNDASSNFTVYCCIFDGFCYRGDPSAVDFNALTVDSAYHDLDLSALIPPGAKSAFITWGLTDAAVQRNFNLRANGQANAINTLVSRNQVADVRADAAGEIYLDSGRVIEYRITTGTDSHDLTVTGWRF